MASVAACASSPRPARSTPVEPGRDLLLAAGQPAPYCTEVEPDLDFDGTEPANATEGLTTWQAECAAARFSVAASGSLDVIGKNTWRGRGVLPRRILVHMIEGYARHNGHADLWRQAIDGAALHREDPAAPTRWGLDDARWAPVPPGGAGAGVGWQMHPRPGNTRGPYL